MRQPLSTFRDPAFALVTVCAIGMLARAAPSQEPVVDVAPVRTESAVDKEGFVLLFNGKDLTGWIPKIRGYPAGENFGDTFRVEDGVLKVDYESYESFDGRFGHLFHEAEFSSYVLRLEYRFTGEQLKGAPGWAFRNSGVMIHGQSPQSMGKNQNFPVCIEVQLLGGDGENDRTTANLCTPGTNVVMDGKLERRHCISSKSKTYHGDQWVAVEIEVRGGEVVRHKIDGKIVLEYREPQLDERDADAKEMIEARGGEKLLSGGTISLQSESHACEFRNIRIKLLEVPQEEGRIKERDDGKRGRGEAPSDRL